MNSFCGPMQAWPGLQECARRVVLSRSGLGLYLYDAGPAEAPVVMLLHGLGDEADSWRHLIKPLAARHRVVAPDLPGFGRSDALAGGYTMPLLIDSVLELMDTLSIAGATLIGSSLGAMLAHYIALEHSERVEGLVLVGGTLNIGQPRLGLKRMLYLLPGIGEWLIARLRGNPQAVYEALRPYYADLDGLSEADRSFLFQRANERVRSDRYRRAYLSMMRQVGPWVARLQGGLDARLARLSIPTLVVCGEWDQGARQRGQALAAIQPSAKLAVILEAGHLVQQERPEELLQAIRADRRLAIG